MGKRKKAQQQKKQQLKQVRKAERHEIGLEEKPKKAKAKLLLAYLDHRFIYIEAKYQNFEDWLAYEGFKGDINDLILGETYGKDILIFQGQHEHKIARGVLDAEDFKQLQKICKKELGTGYYKVFNGMTDKGEYMGTLLGFDVRPSEQDKD